MDNFNHIRLMKSFLITLLCLISIKVFSQDSTLVTIKGKVIDTNSYRPYYNLMVVNKSTGIGHFGSSTGKFSIKANKNDTILLSTTGYQTISLCMKDKDYKSEYYVEYYLSPWSLELAEAQVTPLKTSDELEKERNELERDEVDRIKGVEAFASPITALYQFFSKKEKSKRLVAEMEYQDKKAEVLKELFRLYVAHDIIDLSPNEFDSFVEFINVPDSFFRNASEYEMILYIKERYRLFLRKSDYYVPPPDTKKD